MTAITKETWQSEVLDNKGVTLVDFWAPWCGPCRMIAPVIEEISNENTNIKVCKLNTDDSPELPKEYNIMGIPTIILFKDGKEVERIVGAVSKVSIQQKIDGLI